MRLENVDGFSFDFTDAIDAFVFDEKDPGKPTFHGLPMKGVDIVVELEEAYLFVEIKDFDDPDAYDIKAFQDEEELKKKGAGILRDKTNIKWGKDRGKDVDSAPWYHLFKGDRINDHHLSLAEKRAAREEGEG